LPVLLLIFFTISHGVPALASSTGDDVPKIPHVSAKARESFIRYTYAGEHKAFAIAPGGAWAWRSDALSPEEAEQLALSGCEANTRQKCVLYALDNQIVFDPQKWPTLWGPYRSAEYAHGAETGSGVNQRFYDLTFRDADGNTRSLADLRGKIVFIHFWGSWCPPCLREFPSLQKLHDQLDEKLAGEVVMVLLQVREPYTRARLWAEQQGFAKLPLYDSGKTGDEDTRLSLADGDSVEDRLIARVFPSSYVLDKNGLVIFSHLGPVEDWTEYVDFFEHAVQHNKQGNAATTLPAAKTGN